MKITVCDPCYREDNKVTPTNIALKIKGHSHLNIEICEEHKKEFTGIPMPEYEKRVMQMYMQSEKAIA